MNQREGGTPRRCRLRRGHSATRARNERSVSSDCFHAEVLMPKSSCEQIERNRVALRIVDLPLEP
jgi:hypothetical protein